MAPPAPTVAVVVAVWGGTPPERSFMQLAPTLASASAHVDERIAVFNGPSDARERWVMTGVDRHASLSENAGVARGWNIGWQLSTASFVCFLNEDAVVEPGGLDPLVRALVDEPAIGMVGPRGALWDPESVVHSEYVTTGASPVHCDAASGYALMARTEALHDIGGFDEAFSPCGGEEVDASFAMRRAGWEIAAVDCPGIAHEWGVSRASPLSHVRWVGGNEALIDISARNTSLLYAKWSASGAHADGAGLRRPLRVAAPATPSRPDRLRARGRYIASAAASKLRPTPSTPEEKP